ncbi:helix-turn-helix protein [Roseiarcus fermentans]|uniref:Helix-turn-helix protein n=1 Tax=Roseiarcus fermentans TaxID=1473586 RepID=A0A366F5K4_9HYPH|nr:helix-turn-helix domain-containing protein [Roseiarcus fermentans]RBP09240.1 helix-turn-helix protein [Roseiarcus fermentans]
MTRSSLRERFERLGRVRGIDPVRSGSRAIVSLRLSGSLDGTKSVEAVIALRRRGAPTLKAKRAVEAAMEGAANVLELSTVEDPHALAGDLRRSGFVLSVVTPLSIDVRKLRDRLGLTQEQFALRFGLELDAVRNWEYGRREPDAAARSYLTIIEKAADVVQDVLAVPVE